MFCTYEIDSLVVDLPGDSHFMVEGSMYVVEI